jgi:hypothetical protein
MSSIIIAWSLELGACGCYAVATFKRLPKFSTTLAKELEAYTINVTLPIVLPFGALLTPDPMTVIPIPVANGSGLKFTKNNQYRE